MSQSSSPADTIEPVRVPISKRIFLINSLSGVATQLLTVGVFAWVIQYLMKRIPEEELALLPVVLSAVMILPLLQTILSGGLARFITEAYARNDLDGITKIVTSQFPLLLVGGLLTMALGTALAWNIEHVLNIPTGLVNKARFMMLLIVARMAIGMFLAPFNTGLHANQRFVLQNLIDIGSSLLRIALMLLLVVGISPNIEWVVVANISSQLAAQFAGTAISVSLLPALRLRRGSFDWQTCRRILAFSGWNFITESARLIRRAADAPILNLFATPIAVNDFFLGSLIETQLRNIVITASQPLMPALTAMHAREQNTRLAAAFLRGGRIALWASMFLATPMIVFSYELFELYLGTKYLEHVNAGTVMIILLLTFPLGFPTMMFSRICYARAEIRPIAVRVILAELGNLALTLVLVGTFHLGSIGSATATLATFAIIHPLFLWPLAVRSLEVPWRRFLSESLVPGMVPAVVAGSAAMICRQIVGESAAVRVAAGIPISIAVYTVCVAFVLRPVDRKDLVRIRQFVMGRFS